MKDLTLKIKEYVDEDYGVPEWSVQIFEGDKLTHSWSALTEKGRNNRVKLATELINKLMK